MTKSVAAFIPFSGVLLYAILTNRLGRILGLWPRYAFAGAVALMPLLLFTALREAASPGMSRRSSTMTSSAASIIH
jgi:hypothetical protein